MTTTDEKVLHRRYREIRQAESGVHAPLIITEIPAAASRSLLGQSLEGQVLTVDGDYVCLIPIAGLASSLKTHITATLDSMTAVVAGPDELADFDPRTVNVADATVLTSGTGDGSLVTTVEQVASLTLTGAKYARVVVTLGGAPTSVTFTRAQYVGL